MKSSSHVSTVAAGILFAALASGCATEDTTAPAAAQAPRSRTDATITGSHIPNKNAQPTQSDVEREKSVERMKELQKTSTPVQTKP